MPYIEFATYWLKIQLYYRKKNQFTLVFILRKQQ